MNALRAAKLLLQSAARPENRFPRFTQDQWRGWRVQLTLASSAQPMHHLSVSWRYGGLPVEQPLTEFLAALGIDSSKRMELDVKTKTEVEKELTEKGIARENEVRHYFWLPGEGSDRSPGPFRETCDFPGCSTSAAVLLVCKFCPPKDPKSYAHCRRPEHKKGIEQAFLGHGSRVHPAEFPDLMRAIAANPPILADLRQRAKEQPELWSMQLSEVERYLVPS